MGREITELWFGPLFAVYDEVLGARLSAKPVRNLLAFVLQKP